MTKSPPPLRISLSAVKGSREYRIAFLYWATKDDGRFRHRITDLAHQFNTTPASITKTATQCSKVYRDDYRCAFCHRYTYAFTGRADKHLKLDGPGEHFYCNTPECKEKARAWKLEKMAQAFHLRKANSLNPYEFRFLQLLAQHPFVHAVKMMGISKKDGEKLLRKYHRQHLINYGIGIESLEFLPEFQRGLLRVQVETPVKSVFGSPQAKRVYHRLQEIYPQNLIFPEMPLCAFIPLDKVEMILTDNWQKEYFYKSRLDFVVCDPGGVPVLACEYDGGYHEGTQRLDKLKDRILNAVGLPVRRINKDNLDQLK